MVKKNKVAKVNKGNTKPLFTQSRNWCLTSFNMEYNWEELWKNYNDIIRYMCIGREICPNTGKRHFQGWIQLINKKTLGGVKRIIGDKKIHLESCRGNEYDNDKYCKKENKYEIWGEKIIQGQRTDLELIKKKIEDGVKMVDIAKDHFGDYIRYYSGFNKYKALIEKEKTKNYRKVEVIVLSGKTGTGKTRKAMKEKNIYKIEGQNIKWWDGYEGEKNILIDEYNNDISITQLLNLLDGYQLRLEKKGTHTYANWNKVYITTNLTKYELHENAKKEHRNALFRRIKKWINYK